MVCQKPLLRYRYPLQRLNEPKTTTNGTKFPLIPPPSNAKQIVAELLIKTNALNDRFSQPCTAICNNSSSRDHPLITYAKFYQKLTFLTPWYVHNFGYVLNEWLHPTNPTFEAKNRLSTLEFSIADVIKFIRSLVLNKAHGYDEIFIRIIRIHDILKALHIAVKKWENHRFTKK